MKKFFTLLAVVLLSTAVAHAQSVAPKSQSQSVTTDTIIVNNAPARPNKSYGLYEEELPRSVKRFSTKTTVEQADTPAAEPMKADTTRLEVTPGPRTNLSSQMAPPERASGKVMRTRTVRTIQPAANSQTTNQ